MPLPRLRIVGRIRSRHRSPSSIPGGGGPAEAVVAPQFAAGLRGIEKSSHLILVAWLDRARRGALTVRRSGERGVQALGVFATRCPARPNPVAVTVARLLGRRGRTLRLDQVDLADGTPLLDVKPYVPGADAVFSARRSGGRPRARLAGEDLAGFLERELENHLGPDAGRPAARAALRAVAAAVRDLGVEPRDPALRVTVSRGGAAADALMGLLGATLASGRVRMVPARGPLAFRFRAGRRRLAVRPGRSRGERR
ncbi:MAG TPA: tRNA (N6-threonylcarbamoyladenosine(37)-N6)-methyltransferase TrmO [Anaeromyxobacteraceae bacterium]